jgi:uncharacterized membrane protein YdjX (TVP38/TMEM64 family)
VTDRPKPKWARIALLVLLIGGIYVVGRTTGFLDDINIEKIRLVVNEAGPFGFLVYVGLFALGVFINVPGFVFVATAILVYGKILGGFAALIGAIVSVCVAFAMVRAVGGNAFAAIKSPRIRRMLDRLEQHPVRMMVALRTVMFISPPLNYALALSRIRFRDYALGSAIGLVIPTTVVTVAFDWLFQTPWVSKWLFG